MLTLELYTHKSQKLILLHLFTNLFCKEIGINPAPILKSEEDLLMKQICK